ncbi:MAG: hypothetical protein EGR02_01205 [Clostridiales bacterium]|nr:hypothetical protein [Clostridiales bacterium]
MTHCYTDFLLLCALGTARKNEALADALTNTDALLCGCLTEDTLIHGLTVLQNEGYISLPGGEADADTVCLLTAKGRQAIAVPVLSRLFGRRDAVLFVREDAFLAAPAGNGGATVVLRPGAFDTVHSRLLRAAGANEDYDGAPWITVARCEGGMAVTFRVPGEEGPDESDDSDSGGSYDGAAPEDALAMSDSVRAVYPDGLSAGRFTDLLLAVRDFFCGKPQVRKAALPAGTDLYAVSLIREDAEAVRVSAAPIRFNKQRFRGGRDGELDYAQCGDDVLYFTEDGYRLAGVLCAAYASVWELLEDGERAALNELRRHIR